METGQTGARDVSVTVAWQRLLTLGKLMTTAVLVGTTVTRCDRHRQTQTG